MFIFRFILIHVFILNLGFILVFVLHGFFGFFLALILQSIFGFFCIFILQGILLYALRSRRGWQMAAYAAVSLAAYVGLVGYQLTAQGLPLSALLTEVYQWMEIFAIPLMLCYNGQRGWGYQKLFYVFYPAHVYVLYALSWLLMVFAPQLAA